MKNKGFTLVELVVTISIMAIMMMVFAPTMIAYTERARMGRDESAMDEVVNALVLSASEQSVYDELTAHRIFDNVSCYIDSETEADYEIIPTKVDENGNITMFETTSPGLRGQSGGPIFSPDGLIYGIQSMTKHIDLNEK